MNISRDEESLGQRWQSTSRSAHLAGRRNADTFPEVRLRSALHREGARFGRKRKLAPGCNPDIVMPRRRLAVFVDGCFWHGCPLHGRKAPWSGPNAELWRKKLERTAVRDAVALETASSLGWRAVRVWECEILVDAEAVARRILGLELERDA